MPGKHFHKILALAILLIAGLFLSACSQKQESIKVTPATTPTSTLPAPSFRITPAPSVESVVNAYFTAWKDGDFETMYSLISAESQASMDFESFVKIHRDLAYQLTLDDLDFSSRDTVVTPANAEVNYDLVLKSSLVGEIHSSNQMTLVKEQADWRINWSPGLILPELAEGLSLRMDLDVPERGNILDRNGLLLAGTQEAAAIGLYPDYMDPEKAESIVSLLARLTGKTVPQIVSRYINYPPGTVGYLPLGEVAVSENQRLIDILSGASGVVIEPYTARFYPENGAAPHAVGYVSPLQQGAEEEEYRRKGYRVDANIGRTGLEEWGEDLLSGKNGASLYLVDAEGRPQALLGQVPYQPSQVITTTLERDFQAGVQQAIAGLNAAVVVLERDTGRILAMASSPAFDPNAYQTANFNWSSLLQEMGNNPNQPLFNRATMGQYPLGSVFKLITAAAALESGRFTPASTYDCQYVFEELPGTPLYDWTYERFQKDGVTRPSGLLTLPEGLIRSCNPWFYHIGLDLFNAGSGKLVSDMARGFGLGQKTGLEGMPEEAGSVPDPGSPLDATNIAIGQGNVLVTPLQVARFAAALGNGGRLLRPQIIEKIAASDGTLTRQFAVEEQGRLPISQENLSVIQKAMLGVTSSKNPVGTAFNTFNGFSIPVHGKTGTATAPAGEPHAWFAGYTAAEKADRPDIAVAVIVENQGEGSQWAAPVFRRVIELYFYGQPQKLYRWEISLGITKTPTPFGFELTPTPEEGQP
jgi:penicillin-binding protein 2